jgi:hypothetical protein
MNIPVERKKNLQRFHLADVKLDNHSTTKAENNNNNTITQPEIKTGPQLKAQLINCS